MNKPEQSGPISRPRLIAMAHSHYAEVARWALDAAKVDYVEERHLPLLHRLHTMRVGGGSVPVLITSAKVYTESCDILKYAAAMAPTALGSGDPVRQQQSDELVEYFGKTFGPHTRRWAYFQMLGSVDLLNACVSSGVPRNERWATPVVMCFVRPLIRRVMRITPESANRSLATVRTVFARVGELLADGRHFLADDHLGPADIAFAALAAPVLLPMEFGGALPELAAVNSSMREEVLRLRAKPAGEFALRLYKAHR